MSDLFAVITGASSGIGFELARQFGSHGHDLMIVSGSDDIFSAQEELMEEGFTVDAVKANLATFAGVENLYEQIRASGRSIDALVVSATAGVGGSFIETDLREEINLINLNIVSVVHLTKNIVPDMKLRGSGKILFTSMIASKMSSSTDAVYDASKAFLSSFAEALRNELRDSGISITVLMPGATKTHFFHRAPMDFVVARPRLKKSYDPIKVAAQGFEALMEGKERLGPESLFTKLQSYALKMLPHKESTKVHRKVSEPGHH